LNRNSTPYITILIEDCCKKKEIVSKGIYSFTSWNFHPDLLEIFSPGNIVDVK
jgi:hypothetical protein